MTIEGLWGWKLEPSVCDLTAEEGNGEDWGVCESWHLPRAGGCDSGLGFLFKDYL
jgi:hypothetical protein